MPSIRTTLPSSSRPTSTPRNLNPRSPTSRYLSRAKIILLKIKARATLVLPSRGHPIRLRPTCSNGLPYPEITPA